MIRSDSIVTVAVIAASVGLVAVGCPPAAAPAVAGSAGLFGVNVANVLRSGRERK